MASFSMIDNWGRPVYHLLRSRWHSYDGLWSCKSLKDVQSYAADHQLLGFNKDAVRAAVIGYLARTYRATVFVETGTYHGATALCASRYLRVPVYSCEISFKRFVLTRIITLGERRIRISWKSSGPFIAYLADRGLLRGRPVFYLDAHWRDYLPLVDEVALVTELDRFLVVVDDFRVPFKEDYGFDTYANCALDIDLIRGKLLAAGITRCYFPDYPPEGETGARRGYCVFWRSEDLDHAVGLGGFPMSLLREHDLG